jgi:hypothetical protein
MERGRRLPKADRMMVLMRVTCFFLDRRSFPSFYLVLPWALFSSFTDVFEPSFPLSLDFGNVCLGASHSFCLFVVAHHVSSITAAGTSRLTLVL